MYIINKKSLDYSNKRFLKKVSEAAKRLRSGSCYIAYVPRNDTLILKLELKGSKVIPKLLEPHEYVLN